MTGEDIPDADSVVRYIGGSKIADGIVLGEAFRLPSENPERDRLSINWLDCFRGLSKAEQMSEVRRLSRLTFRPNGRLVELNVGATREYLHQELNALRFVKTPLDANPPYQADPSHGDIIGLPAAESPMASLVGDLIAECVQTIHPAVPP